MTSVISGYIVEVLSRHSEERRSASVDVCIGVDVACWLEKYAMSLLGPAIVHLRAVRTTRGTF